MVANYRNHRLLGTAQLCWPTQGGNSTFEYRAPHTTRTAPVDAWNADPGWATIVRTLRLGPLDETSSRALLERHGIPAESVTRLLHFTRDHPLALRLAGQTFEDRPDQALDEAECRPAVDVLAPMFLRDEPAGLSRQTWNKFDHLQHNLGCASFV